MNRLKELRLAHGYKSQKELADILFVNQTAVSQWERGVTMPSGPMLLKLSRMYGVSTDYILGNSNEKLPDRKEKPTSVSGDGRSDAERLFMPLVDKLTPEQQQLLLVQLQAWTGQDVPLAPAGPDSNREKGAVSDL